MEAREVEVFELVNKLLPERKKILGRPLTPEEIAELEDHVREKLHALRDANEDWDE